MSQVNIISGSGIALKGNDIDTDRIIPARFLKCVTFDGLGNHAFEDDRAQLNGNHPFDQPHYQNAEVLVVNRNFGCGSSREHAPQAIARWGIKALIGESFAEIFFGNCVAMGIPCVVADAEDVTQLQNTIEGDPAASITVNVETMQVTVGDTAIAVRMGDGPRQMFLAGTWDACGQLVSQAEQIRQTASNLPYVAWGHA
ncbi:MAG: 3-isopropylmalate dehydratase small subunit [Cyanobacteria bacterium P01_E01_bin.6]